MTIQPVPISSHDERLSATIQNDSLGASPKIKKRNEIKRRHHKTKSSNKQPIWDERFYITQQLRQSTDLKPKGSLGFDFVALKTKR